MTALESHRQSLLEQLSANKEPSAIKYNHYR